MRWRCQQMGGGRWACEKEAVVVIDTQYSMIPSCKGHVTPYKERYGVRRDRNGNRIWLIDELTPEQIEKTLAQNMERERISEEIESGMELDQWRRKHVYGTITS